LAGHLGIDPQLSAWVINNLTIAICQIDESNLSQVNIIDGSFIVDARLVLSATDGQISYTIEPVQPYLKRYPAEQFDWNTFIGNPDKAIYLAYVDGQLAGQIILLKNWNGYGYIEDITVDANFRRQGLGRKLIEQAIAWEKERGLPGLMLETQNNNIAGCRLYEACGFHLGGFDRELYKAISPGTDEIALYWYKFF
jgi:ribosomal protein S18 acetylase RimI-like enzyme